MKSLAFSLGLVACLALCNSAYGQFSSKEYLLTIGDLVNKKGFSDPYAISPLQSLYYVQLLQPDYLWKDLTTMIRLKTETGYEDTWLFVDYLSKGFVERISWSETEPIKEPVKELITAPRREPVLKGPSANMTTVVNQEYTSEVKRLEKKPLAPEIKNVNTTKSVNLALPEKGRDGMPTDFHRIKSADYIEYSNVGFYHNAAIIHPSYQAEMASLAAHMKEDLTIELLIHGHCNGNAPRTILTAGIFTKFFEIDSDHQQKIATAKELTELRAAYAKRYLISQGIRPERIQILGEGGERMIYPQTSEHAHYNDRVELVIVKK